MDRDEMVKLVTEYINNSEVEHRRWMFEISVLTNMEYYEAVDGLAERLDTVYSNSKPDNILALHYYILTLALQYIDWQEVAEAIMPISRRLGKGAR